MTTYRVHVESGPLRRKTMVHVLQLLGCVATGPTTEAAIEATPEAIRAYLRFLARHGERVDAGEETTIEVAEHLAEKMTFVGQGAPDIVFEGDLEPITEDELERHLARFRWMREELAAWVRAQPEAALDEVPDGGGRPARAVLFHVLAVPGAYLSPALGGTSGYSRVQTLAERGELALADALLRVVERVEDDVRATTPEQRSAVVVRARGDRRSLRKAVRRVLEHDWEHLAELARRPGGPDL